MTWPIRLLSNVSQDDLYSTLHNPYNIDTFLRAYPIYKMYKYKILTQYNLNYRPHDAMIIIFLYNHDHDSMAYYFW